MKKPAVFFDRDNTLIANDGYLGDPNGVVLIDGAADAVARVRQMGFAVVTFSNQSGVARGMFTEEAVHAVNARLDELLQDQNPRAVISRHEFCPFHPEAVVERYRQESELRKPRPGMILQAAERLGLDLEKSWVIGDAGRDIEAAKAAGCRSILFTDPSLAPSSASADSMSSGPEFAVESLKQAVDIIAAQTLGAPPAPLDPPPASIEAPPPTPQASPESPTAPPAAPKTAASPRKSASKKPTFAERVKAGTFTPARAKVAEKAAVDPVADPQSQTHSPQAPVAAPIAVAEEPAPPEAPPEAPPDPAVTAAQATPPEERAPQSAEEPEAPGAVQERPSRKPTFAERVRSGQFQPARVESAPAAATTDRATERVKRPLPIPGERSPDQVGRVVDTLTAPRQTEPLTPGEQLEPVLQDILDEIRKMRLMQPQSDFSVSKLLAGIVQVLVLPVLFFAYLHRDSAADMQSMLMLATFFQTLVIALLVMGRS